MRTEAVVFRNPCGHSHHEIPGLLSLDHLLGGFSEVMVVHHTGTMPPPSPPFSISILAGFGLPLAQSRRTMLRRKERLPLPSISIPRLSIKRVKE